MPALPLLQPLGQSQQLQLPQQPPPEPVHHPSEGDISAAQAGTGDNALNGNMSNGAGDDVSLWGSSTWDERNAASDADLLSNRTLSVSQRMGADAAEAQSTAAADKVPAVGGVSPQHVQTGAPAQPSQVSSCL